MAPLCTCALSGRCWSLRLVLGLVEIAQLQYSAADLRRTNNISTSTSDKALRKKRSQMRKHEICCTRNYIKVLLDLVPSLFAGGPQRLSENWAQIAKISLANCNKLSCIAWGHRFIRADSRLPCVHTFAVPARKLDARRNPTGRLCAQVALFTVTNLSNKFGWTLLPSDCSGQMLFQCYLHGYIC